VIPYSFSLGKLAISFRLLALQSLGITV